MLVSAYNIDRKFVSAWSVEPANCPSLQLSPTGGEESPLPLPPVFGPEGFVQGIKRLHLVDDHIAGAFTSGHGAFDDEERGFEFILLTLVNLGKDHQRNMAELIFQGDKDDFAAGPLAADDQSGNGYFSAVPESGDIFAAGHFFLKLRAYP